MVASIKRIATKVKTKIKNGLHREAIRAFTKVFPGYRFSSEKNELCRVELLPRYKGFETLLFGKTVQAVDPGSYVAMHREIFGVEIYRFRTPSERPYILDCGANIGFGAIYFKRLYPGARIVAFEPDPHIFGMLENNMRQFGYDGVTLVPKGLWNSEGVVKFVSDPTVGMGGHVVSSGSETLEVPVTRLRSYLDGQVDLLKMDIEGAECVVIADCADLLANVRNIFIEYHSFAGHSQCLGQLLSTLSNAGFRIHMHCCGVHSPNPLVEFVSMDGMDMQLNVFGVRVSEPYG